MSIKHTLTEIEDLFSIFDDPMSVIIVFFDKW